MLIAVIFQTYGANAERTSYAVRCINSINENLQCKYKIGYVIADDGSPESHRNAVRDAIGDQLIIDDLSKRSSYGYMANWAWRVASKYTPVTLWMEDDWVLNRLLDINPYIEALMDNKADIIRLGYMPVGLNLTTTGHKGRMYAYVRSSTQYAFSGNPHLKHTRFEFSYPEGLNPGDTEIAYDGAIRSGSDNRIVWPLAIGDSPYFDHIGNAKSYE